ncbi:MAG: hypothetical protein JNL90_08840 [Planctomycetes bacterium]|nr:hypothetical protein [Planctomycetota bacterium]
MTAGAAGRAAGLLALALLAGGCRSTLHARPIAIEPAAAAPYAEAERERARAATLADPERRAALEAALAAARRAQAAAPDEFRAALLAQDLEFELDLRAARERYVADSAETAAAKVLAARALLPERTAEARTLLTSAIAQDGDFAFARYGLAFLEQREGRADRARTLCAEALARDPTLLESLRMLAELEQDAGSRERALEARTLLIEVTGGDLLERHRLAQLLLEADDRSDATAAEKQLRVILEQLGDVPGPEQLELARDAWLDLGTAFARRSRDAEAIAAWEHALALDRECLTALYNIGVVEMKQRRHPELALLAFEEYLLRAQTMTRPLPADQIFYRLFYVPNQVRELREQLQRAAPTPAIRDPFEAEPPAGGSAP